MWCLVFNLSLFSHAVTAFAWSPQTSSQTSSATSSIWCILANWQRSLLTRLVWNRAWSFSMPIPSFKRPVWLAIQVRLTLRSASPCHRLFTAFKYQTNRPRSRIAFRGERVYLLRLTWTAVVCLTGSVLPQIKLPRWHGLVPSTGTRCQKPRRRHLRSVSLRGRLAKWKHLQETPRRVLRVPTRFCTWSPASWEEAHLWGSITHATFAEGALPSG